MYVISGISREKYEKYLLESVGLSGEFLEAAVVVLHRLEARRRDEDHVGRVLRRAQGLERLIEPQDFFSQAVKLTVIYTLRVTILDMRVSP